MDRPRGRADDRARRWDARRRDSTSRRHESPVQRGSQPLHIWSVGFAGEAAEQIQRACEHVGAEGRRFEDAWRLMQYLMPCFGGALVRRPDLLLVDADQLGQHDLEWLQDIEGPLPIWQVSGAAVLAEGEASFAQRLRAAARAWAESTGAA